MEEVKHKTCKQCGQIKAIDEFRPYYHKAANKKATHYRICKGCESINTRFKYLNTKQDKSTITDREVQELEKINQLFDLLETRGLTPPKRAHEDRAVSSLVDQLLQTHLADAERAAEITGSVSTPAELTDWLLKPLAGDPDDLEDEFDELERRYRPQTGVDQVTYKPIFDDTYKDVLMKIEDRVEDYRKNYDYSDEL
jgi:hypothetical protein